MSSSDLDFGTGLGVCARVGTSCDFAQDFRVTGRGVVDLVRDFAGSWICTGASATTKGAASVAAATAAAPPAPGGGPPDELLGVAKAGVGCGGGFGMMCKSKALPPGGGGGGPPPSDGFANIG